MASQNSSTVESEIKRTQRDAPPAHYIFKIKPFSQFLEILTNTGDYKYESDEFEAGDYKWKLVVYPTGNEKGNGKGHISMYIASTDKKAISSGCHVYALFNLFVYDHIRDKFLTIQDGNIKRYHALKTEHGFDQLLPLEEFNDTSNGYLVNDCCVFGAEVHVIKNTVKANEFSVIKDPPNDTFTWKIVGFSTFRNWCHYSDKFNIGGHNWKLKLYPKGITEKEDRYMSLYLLLLDNNVTSCQGVYAECNILIQDQLQGKHHERIINNDWFGGSVKSWGYPELMLLSDLNNASNGFLVNDTLVIKATITLVSSVQDFS